MGQMTVWTTEAVERTKENLRFGIQADMSCFHDRDVELKGGNILFRLSAEEVEEFQHCSRNINYFVEKYCRFLTDNGRATVNLREYQKDILRELAEEQWIDALEDMGPKVRNYILMAARQTGKTTTIAAYFAWYLCFHSDRNLAILANKEKTAFEIVSKVIDVFRGLPFFLKPGMIKGGAGGMQLDNGCQLMSQATTKTAQIGFTIHVLYADEFAHIAPNIVRDFWKSVYPTLASSRISQCIITSTPAGSTNLFAEIWTNAVKGHNSFKYKKVDYYQVPEHDEKWAKQMRNDFGEEAFAQEFELKFNSDSNHLMGEKEMAFLKKIEAEYVFKDLERSKLDESLYRNLKWHPDFDPNERFDPKRDFFVISTDTGEGRDPDEVKDNDYNILSIYKIEPKSLVQLNRLRPDQYYLRNMFRFRQIGLYRDNLKDDEVCSKVARSISFDQLNPECVVLVVEMNFNGKYFIKIFSEDDAYYEDMIMRTYHTKPIPGQPLPNKKAGFRVNADKEHYCKQGKAMIRDKTLIPNDSVTVLEFSAFGKDRRGKYKGIGTHDDTVMAALNTSRLYEEPMYEDRLYDILDQMEDCPQRRLINLFLNKVEGESEMTDNMFSTMFTSDDNLDKHTTDINEIFKREEENKFRRNSLFRS
jgi:hypothetical protein